MWQMFARFKRVVGGPAPYRCEDVAFRFVDRYGRGESFFDRLPMHCLWAARTFPWGP